MKFLVLDDRDYIIISQGGGGATISCIILIFIIIILLYPRVEEVEVCRLPLELHEIASQAWKSLSGKTWQENDGLSARIHFSVWKRRVVAPSMWTLTHKKTCDRPLSSFYTSSNGWRRDRWPTVGQGACDSEIAFTLRTFLSKWLASPIIGSMSGINCKKAKNNLDVTTKNGFDTAYHQSPECPSKWIGFLLREIEKYFAKALTQHL